MATTYDPICRLAIMTPLDPSVKNSWGTIAAAAPTLIPQAAQGYLSINIAGLAVRTLSTANNAADEARYMAWNFTGALGAVDCQVTIPAIARCGWARNATTGGKNVILGTGGGSTLFIAPGFTAFWICDGANVFSPAVALGAISGTTGTFSGGITATTGTFSGAISATSGTFSSGGSFGAGVTVGGNLGVSGTLTIGTNAAFGGTLSANALVSNTASITTLAATTENVTTLNAGTLAVSSTAAFTGLASFNGNVAGGATGAFIYNAGGTFTPTAWSVGIGVAVVQSVSATGFFSVSDRRAKTDIADIEPHAAIDWVKRGRARTFTMGGVPAAGFVAQEEVERGRHDAVSMHDDARPEYAESDGLVPAGKRLSRNYSYDVAFLTAALQAALTRIEALEAAAAGGA